MAVYRRTYRAYTGPTTSAWSRFFVIPRYSAMDFFVQVPRFNLMLPICFLPFLVEAAFIYLCHSPAAQALLSMSGTSLSAQIDATFFLRCVTIQGFLAFVIVAWTGPGLVAPDLANGAIPLYLSRPLSRTEYVAGKFVVLFGLLSAITWVPNLLLYFLQAGLEEGWLAAHLRIGGAIFVGSLIWIALLALIALALSATVKRRQAATLLLFGILFGGTAFGEMWRQVLGSAWGRLLNLRYLVELIWYELFGLARPRMIGGVRMDLRYGDLPTWAAWAGIVTICVSCTWLLNQRVRAKEIVR